MSISRFIRQQWRKYQRTQRWLEYNTYLRSDDWKHVRRLKLEFAGHRCEECGSPNELQVHHLTYERFGGDELLTDLQVLCEPCHNQAHGRTF